MPVVVVVMVVATMFALALHAFAMALDESSVTVQFIRRGDDMCDGRERRGRARRAMISFRAVGFALGRWRLRKASVHAGVVDV